MQLAKEILFRKFTAKIPSTKHGVFSLYKYPARFIPQVPAFVMENYAKSGMKIFDPFAGFGTVGFVARLYGVSYELWDLNPLLAYIHSVGISEAMYLDIAEIFKNSSAEFVPKTPNISYWHPEEFLRLLVKAWGVYHNSDQFLKNLLLIPLLKTTKYFSYADEKVHKLYRSKYSREKVSRILKQDYKTLFYNILDSELKKVCRKISKYKKLGPKDVSFNIKAGVDAFEEELQDYVNIMLTSPPYLQAQEYIRTTKLELFWLGFDEAYVRELSKKEIPYRRVRNICIKSPTYYTYRSLIQEPKLIELYDNYFHAIIGILERLSQKITDYLFIFVGPAKIRTLQIPIHEIIAEHMTELGFAHEITYVDKIVSRVMFPVKKNPATGLADERIANEYLVVLKRTK